MKVWLLTALFSALSISGCTTYQAPSKTGALNHPIPISDSPFINIDAPGAQVTSPFLKHQFIGIALSGGGSRAANFSAAVMEQLNHFGFIRAADAISSVSGGGLPGAYYALNGDSTDWNLLKEKLNSDFWGMTMRKWLAPWNLPNAAFSSQSKTDLLADVLDEVLFAGKTYKELQSRGPIFLANATDLTGNGSRVVLSSEYFTHQLNSSVRDFRVANAVAISAAFPGVFDSATLENFRRLELMTPEIGSESWSPPSFVHLIDGGASDNLGIETLWDAALTQLYGNMFRNMPEHFEDKPFIIISVDANAPNTNAVLEKYADNRRFFDRIFNSNIFGGIDALFEGRRRENLIKVGLGQTYFPSMASEGFFDIEQRYVKSKRTSEFKVPVICRPYFGIYKCLVDYSEPIGPSKKFYFSGIVWHISLDEIASFAGLSLRFDGSDYLRKPRRAELVRLQRLVAQIKTHFKLVGPDGCSSTQLQDGLYTAAKVLVLEDEESRFTICDYMKQKGVIGDTSVCKKQFPPSEIVSNVEGIEQNFPFSKSSNSSGNLPVRCRR